MFDPIAIISYILCFVNTFLYASVNSFVLICVDILVALWYDIDMRYLIIILFLTGCTVTIESKELDLIVLEGDFTPAFHLHMEDSKITIPVL